MNKAQYSEKNEAGLVGKKPLAVDRTNAAEDSIAVVDQGNYAMMKDFGKTPFDAISVGRTLRSPTIPILLHGNDI